ncbi:MAG: FeoB-associated Cys-rich membrane protein [Roseburia sp.]
MGTVITGIGLAGIIALVVRSMIRDKKNGKSPQCGGDCGHCGGGCH